MSVSYESFGKYVLLEKLATGGMAEVFLARGSGAGGIGRFFAIKRILPQYADSPEFIEMFKDEAKIAINLNHSNVVSIVEFGVEKGQFYLVMDYVEGRNLRQILNKMKKTGVQFSIDQIVYMIKEIASGLDHAHRCIDGTTGKPLNITHRDMSPQNVMVSFEGEVKIVDFGIAKAESQLETTRAGTLKGKFGYMSPEQAEGQPVDLRTDIFSLGIVAWELLANDRLFVANNEINTLRKIRDCQIPSLRKLNPNIHSELERIVQKALARDRNLRYQTGAALHRDLNRFLNRQYPDFSTQDFAVFIKSAFADEILSLRKRLVDYSKVNLSINLQTPRLEEEKTSLLNTNTNSLVLTSQDSALHSQVKPDLRGLTDETMFSNPSGSAPPLRTGELSVAGQTATQQTLDSERIGPANTDEHNQPTRVVNPSDKRPPDPPLPKTDELPTVVSPYNPGVLLDEAALAKASDAAEKAAAKTKSKRTHRLSQDSNPHIETEQISHGNYRDRRVRSRTVTNARFPIPKRQKSASVRFASIMVFSLLCISVYAYLVKYFTPMMQPVLAITDPTLHGFHVALGVEYNVVRDPANQLPDPPVPQPQATITPDNTSTPPVPTPNPPAHTGSAGIVVTSNPSGAEVYLNDRPTGLVTPTRIEVSSGEAFTVAVKKRGYLDYVVKEATRESLGHRIDANLRKMNVAYVDIEIFPPQDAKVTINGRPVQVIRSMVRDVSIPANTPVKVRAESASGFEEMTITLAADRKKALRLNPRKNARVPANQ